MSEPTGIEKFDNWLKDPKRPPDVRERWIELYHKMGGEMPDIWLKNEPDEKDEK